LLRACTIKNNVGSLLSSQWQKNDVITTAIETGNPRVIEENLQDYHDVMAEAGGILYAKPSRDFDGCIGSKPFGHLGLKTKRDILRFQGLIRASSEASSA